MLGVLIPTRERHDNLNKCLQSLSASRNSDKLDVVIVFDGNNESVFNEDYRFNGLEKIYPKERQYPVKAFNLALKNCKNEMFCWVTDITIFIDPDWINIAVDLFEDKFSDGIGVMSLLHGGGAKFGITTKKFVDYNGGEWFHSGYRVHYPDVELTHRAILMGRYGWADYDLVYHDKVAKMPTLAMPSSKRYEMIKADKILYGKRRSKMFDLHPKKIYYASHDFQEYVQILGWGGFLND